MKPKKRHVVMHYIKLLSHPVTLDTCKLHLSGPNILLIGIDSHELRAGAVLRSYPLIRRFVISFFLY